MVHAWVAILVGLVGVLIGALGGSWVIHVKVVDRLGRVESEVESIRRNIDVENDRTDTRIFEVVGLVKEIIGLSASDREEWRTLRADMKSLIEVVRDGR